MDVDKQVNLEYVLLYERECRVCGQTKNLIEDFYLTRRDRGSFPSSYSYECKECTKKRVLDNRKKKAPKCKWEYPDW